MASKRIKATLVLSIFLWILAVLTLAFNILGLWAPWHLAGFGFVFYLPIPTIASICSFVASVKEKKAGLVFKTLLYILVNAAITAFTVFVSSTWFW
jgi:hypothetical protein